MPIDLPKNPGPVPVEVLNYFKKKRLKPGFSYLDVWRQEHATAFTVAKLLEKDLLDDVRRSIEKAITEGTPFQQWAKEVRPTFDKSGWSSYGTPDQRPYRLKRIYETNLRVARAQGQYDRIQRTRRALPYLEYVLGPSEVHRPEHEEWAGLVLPSDDPWWDTHYPPNGYGCKCSVRQLTTREAEARGIDTAPDDGTYEWKNPKTGQVEEIPNGVSPGWDHNPGRDRQQALQDAEEER